MLERNAPAVAVAGQKLELSHVEGWLDGEGLPDVYLQGNLSRQTVHLEDELEVVAGAHHLRLRPLYGAGRLSAELEVQVLMLERAMAQPALDEGEDDRMMITTPVVPPRVPVAPVTPAWTLTWREHGLVWGPADGELAMSDALPYTLVWNDQSLVWPPADGEWSMESVE